MTSQETVSVRIGLPAEHLQRAAELYYLAFRQKLHPIFRDERRGIDVLRQSLDPQYAIVALLADQLVGIAGFKTEAGNLIDIQPRSMTQSFGFLGGWLRLLGLALFARPTARGVLLMDGIVVNEALRGKGVGSKLLDAVMALAREQGYQSVRLDVVDSNPRARQLYERKGFAAVHSQRYPLLRYLFGFSGSTTMLNDLAKSR